MSAFERFSAAALAALLISGPVVAQSALVGIDDLEDRIDDIQEDIEDDMDTANDEARFGPEQFGDGWKGSFSLGFSASSGNTDTTDLTLGGRLRYGAGLWNHTVGFAGHVAEDDDVRNEEEAFFTYDANRYFTDSFYLFGMASLQYDNFSTNEWDAFLGVGPGWRIINNDKVAWRVQAGPGARYIEDQLGEESTEFAGIAASRFYWQLSDTTFVTNDTDVLHSETGTLVSNELGMNLKMTEAMATRISWRTEYDSDPLPGYEDTDNTLGVSLVYGF